MFGKYSAKTEPSIQVIVKGVIIFLILFDYTAFNNTEKGNDNNM